MAYPVEIDRVALRVRDLPAMTAWYREALGLNVRSQDRSSVELGTADKTLLELRGDPALRPGDPRQAGLFHNAFLLPSRADLSRWLAFAAQSNLALQGAADHGVSDALYLADPEGNGIEIYADRPVSEWNRQGDTIEMYTHRLDLDKLLAESSGAWQGIPEGSIIGHVHLQVGDLGDAYDFMAGRLGLTQTYDARGGLWFGSGGYHHQLAGNVWNSRGAGRRPTDMPGLDEVVLRINDTARAQIGEGARLDDPWGTPFLLEDAA
ncbi:VOC family protein [Paracoccus pacificus]|uniref:VOC family protein n=1 Tax=Paracoccus pacificus TaxID=1463598 RepID=A0ABW4RA16_9RHOB